MDDGELVRAQEHPLLCRYVGGRVHPLYFGNRGWPTDRPDELRAYGTVYVVVHRTMYPTGAPTGSRNHGYSDSAAVAADHVRGNDRRGSRTGVSPLPYPVG